MRGRKGIARRMPIRHSSDPHLQRRICRLARAAPKSGDFEPPFRLKAAAIFRTIGATATRPSTALPDVQPTGRDQSMGRLPLDSLSLLISVVEGGRSYKEVAADLGVARSTVEPSDQRPAAQASAKRCAGLDPGGLAGQPGRDPPRAGDDHSRRASHDVGAPPPPCRVVLDADEVAAGASRLRSCCRSANRDIALIIHAAVHRPQDHGTRAAGGGRLPG